MSHVKAYSWEIEMAQFQNGSKSRSRVFLLRWLTFLRVRQNWKWIKKRFSSTLNFIKKLLYSNRMLLKLIKIKFWTWSCWSWWTKRNHMNSGPRNGQIFNFSKTPNGHDQIIGTRTNNWSKLVQIGLGSVLNKRWGWFKIKFRLAIRRFEFWWFDEWPFAVLEKLKIWPFTSKFAIRLFRPFVGSDRPHGLEIVSWNWPHNPCQIEINIELMSES